MARRYILTLVWLLWGMCQPAFGQQQEVTIGAQVWTYDRVYPLLDGMLQDAASTQLQQLILDPNKANSTQLDALIQSFQIQAGFNQLSGVQNSVAAQMSLANLGLQSALTQQQQSVTQQSIVAEQALTKAKQDLLAATAGGNKAQIDAANLAVQNAQAVVDGLTAQAAIVKGSGTPWTPSPASGNSVANPTAFTSGVPSTVLSSGSSSGGPTFPATKQLDNQMDLLWSRLARVVGAMTRPDSIGRDSKMYLIEVDTATFPHKNRKGRLLETRYRLSCGQVVDLFPRVAAVNVANTKYRDNAAIFSVILSWFTFGITGGYNREHLKLSQTLGQSSYITGYGVDQDVFGWKFGIPLGDNFVTSDTKRTFALVSIPNTSECSTPQLSLDSVIWQKPDGSHQKNEGVSTNFGNVNVQMMKTVAPSPHDMGGGPGPIESISFNRASYDPTKYSPANPVLAAVSVTLKEPIDQQATISANGILLKRARDTFGRAIPNGFGSGGLLEQSLSIAQANTWIPISPHNVLITLDAGQFGIRFPTLQITSPEQNHQIVVSSVLPSGAKAIVSGQPFECLTDTPARCDLPSLAYPAVTSGNLSAVLWDTDCQKTDSNSCTDYIVLQSPVAGGPANQQTRSNAQVVSGVGSNPWGPSPEVYLQVPDVNHTQYRLNCNTGYLDVPRDGNLICRFWDENVSKEFAKYALTDYLLTAVDLGHAGGALVASALLPQSAWGRTAHGRPSLWSVSNPQWRDDSKDGGYWEFRIRFANTNEKSVLEISGGLGIKPRQQSCNPDLGICTWTFRIDPVDIAKWLDYMDISFKDDPDDLWHILNVKSQISPYVIVMSSDFSRWSGSNFTQVFSSAHDQSGKTGLVVGKNFAPIDCPVLNSCVVVDASKLKDPDVMYLAALGQKIPLLLLNADGTLAPISFKPSAKDGNVGGAAQPTMGQSGAVQIQNTIVVGGAKN